MNNRVKNSNQITRGAIAMAARLFKVFVMGLLAFTSISTFAAQIQDISYSVMPGDKVEIRVKMDSAPPAFQEITTENPARIWMDLEGVSSALAKKTQNVGIGVTRSVTAVEAGNKTRLVINLVEMTPYNTRVDGNELVVTVGHGVEKSNGGGFNSSVASSSTPTETYGSNNDIASIDFRRGEAGEGRVVVELNNSNLGIDLRQEGRTILADFVNAKVANELIRKLDVVDFATPARIISTSRVGGNVRLSIQTLDEFEYLAYQADNTYIIELKPLTPEEVERKKLDEPVYTGERLSLNFQEIPVRAVLAIIAEFTGLNLVTSDTVTGTITLRLQAVPWDQALDIVLKTRGLDKRQNGNVMLVAPADEIATQEAMQLQNEKQIEQLAPLRTEFIQINYAKAQELADLVRTDGANYLSDRGSISVDTRTNHLIIQDTAKKLDHIRSMVRKLDIPVRQVLIESRVVVADDGFEEELGVRFGITDTGSNGALSGDIIGSDGVFFSGSPAARTFAVDMPVVSPAGSVGLTVARLDDGTILDLELSALESENRGEVIASPRVITANQQEAYIESGEEIPYLQASSAGNTNVTFKKAVLSLTVTPQITPDDRIILDLVVKQDSRGEQTTFGPAINTREVGTQVLVENGETVVLGGVYQQRTNHDVSKVPFLGDLPGIGVLFRSTTDSSAKQELLMFVTPKIVKESVR
ncbi:type IV pilus secretin PilQ [Aliikangiella sp. G2MR2-5]|uniref:type IV pilus secretin PilQ n=1 Tax=Aliikangiella sp. G2MR2-5 TaxID=2788943 RepID=UPI001AEDD829|nr:type IV pilus secretin PilQ [Aliikangiella sp. G2MR2-5]